MEVGLESAHKDAASTQRCIRRGQAADRQVSGRECYDCSSTFRISWPALATSKCRVCKAYLDPCRFHRSHKLRQVSICSLYEEHEKVRLRTTGQEHEHNGQVSHLDIILTHSGALWDGSTVDGSVPAATKLLSGLKKQSMLFHGTPYHPAHLVHQKELANSCQSAQEVKLQWQAQGDTTRSSSPCPRERLTQLCALMPCQDGGPRCKDGGVHV